MLSCLMVEWSVLISLDVEIRQMKNGSASCFQITRDDATRRGDTRSSSSYAHTHLPSTPRPAPFATPFLRRL
jgi:hypothetical protein